MANRRFGSSYQPATSRYGASMGTCYHFPAYARAWVKNRVGETSAEIEITAEQFPDLEPHALEAKALAMIRAQIRR